jgi:ubiquinone/menaquinone biosynthesis C-methylase UbiE
VPTRAEIAARFDEIAEEFDATRTHPWPETLRFASVLPPRSRVLDLGCGNGRNVRAFVERGHSVLGLDASRSILGRAAAKVGTRSLVQGDAVHTPLRSLAVDAVHCVASIHHLPSEGERRQAVAEVVRVLRPRGLVLLSAWAIEQKRFEGALSQDVEVPWRRRDGIPVLRFYHLFRGGELDSLATFAGLAVDRAWRDGDNHVVLASKR